MAKVKKGHGYAYIKKPLCQEWENLGLTGLAVFIIGKLPGYLPSRQGLQLKVRERLILL